MKKFLTIVLTLISCLLLTSCVNVKISDEYTVNEDFSIDNTFQVLVDNNMAMFSDEINKALYNSFTEKGFENIVSAYDGYSFGKKGTKHFEASNSISDVINNQYISITDNSIDYFLFKHFDITANIDIQGILSTTDTEMITLTEYKITINLPIPFSETNSQNVSEDKKSATWYISPSNSNNEIHLECNIINVNNIIITLISLAGIIGLIIAIIAIQHNKKQKESYSDEKN